MGGLSKKIDVDSDPEYCCTVASCNYAKLLSNEFGLVCPNGHSFSYHLRTNVPIFVCENEISNDYTLEDAAVIHDNGLKWVFKTFKTDESSLRNGLLSRLQLSPGMKVLVTGVGAGNDIPFIVEHLEGDGVIYAQDISKQMVLAALERHGNLNSGKIEVKYSISDATNLPFANDTFDVAYHFGGLNLFPDIQKGINEMDRVVKTGGRVVLSDEGLAPWLKTTKLGQMLIKNNPLFAYDAPLSLLPANAKSVNLSWELVHSFYVIDYVVSHVAPDIDIDVQHIGKRGGSIRTRYFGELEGIDPVLRDKLYARAQKLGISRVEFLEKILRVEVE